MLNYQTCTLHVPSCAWHTGMLGFEYILVVIHVCVRNSNADMARIANQSVRRPCVFTKSRLCVAAITDEVEYMIHKTRNGGYSSLYLRVATFCLFKLSITFASFPLLMRYS